MAKAEKAPEENPYVLSTEERTCPKGVSAKEKRAWLNERIALQREGITRGVKPQLLFGVPRVLKPRWRSQVWDEWLNTLPKEERRVVKGTFRSGKQRSFCFRAGRKRRRT